MEAVLTEICQDHRDGTYFENICDFCGLPKFAQTFLCAASVVQWQCKGEEKYLQHWLCAQKILAVCAKTSQKAHVAWVKPIVGRACARIGFSHLFKLGTLTHMWGCALNVFFVKIISKICQIYLYVVLQKVCTKHLHLYLNSASIGLKRLYVYLSLYFHLKWETWHHLSPCTFVFIFVFEVSIGVWRHYVSPRVPEEEERRTNARPVPFPNWSDGQIKCESYVFFCTCVHSIGDTMFKPAPLRPK